MDARFSCVFPPGDEPDPAVVRAIRRQICPNFVPMWVAHNWRTPSGGIHTVKYHVLGTWQAWPTDGKEPVAVLRDSSFPFRGGVVYAQRPWCGFWPDGSWQKQANLPGQGYPFDWEVFEFVQGIYVRLKIPFGTPAVGDMSGAARHFTASRRADAEGKAESLEKVKEGGRLRFRESMKTNYGRKALKEYTDDLRSGRSTLRYKDVTPMVYLKNKTRTKRARPAPPAAMESGAPGIR